MSVSSPTKKKTSYRAADVEGQFAGTGAIELVKMLLIDGYMP